MRRPLTSRLRTATATAILTLIANASAQARQGISGRVLDDQEHPLAGMRVRLVQELAEPDLQTPDIVEAATDDRGRFRANLLFGAAYVASAFGPPADSGSRLVADELFPVQAGSTPVLNARNKPPVAWGRVQGFAAWRGEGPLRLVALAGGRLGDESDLGDPTVDGWRPPPLSVASDRVELELRDARGGVVTGLLFRPPFDLAIPAPTDLAVTVVDASGTPMAGAKVAHISWRTQAGRSDLYSRQRERWRQRSVGITDVHGECRVRVCHWDPLDKATPVLLVESPDGGQVLTWSHHNEPPTTTWTKTAQPQVRIVCAPPAPISGRTLFDGKPLAGLLVDVHTSVGPLWSSAGSNGTDGSFRLPGIPEQENTGFLHLGLRWADPGRAAKEPQFVLPPLEGVGLEKVHLRAFGDLEISRFRAICLQVLDPRNGPGREAVVVVSASYGECSHENSPFRFATDAAGRVPNLLCAPGHWLAFASNGHESGYTAFDGTSPAVPIAMRPVPKVTCSVRDAAGAPVVGATLWIQPAPCRDTQTPYFVSRCEGLALRTWHPRTGADGRVELSMPAWCFDGGTLTAELRSATGPTRSTQATLERSHLGSTIELRMP